MDEKQAIARLKQGDLDGLEFLVRQYQAKAVHTAYLITGDPAAAEDVAQAAFLRLARTIDQFDAETGAGQAANRWAVHSKKDEWVQI